MASDTSSTKRIETTNPEAGTEVRVSTVDHRSLPGQGKEVKTTEPVQVIHEVHPGAGSGALAGATEAVANAIQAAKGAISGNNNATESNK